MRLEMITIPGQRLLAKACGCASASVGLDISPTALGEYCFGNVKLALQVINDDD